MSLSPVARRYAEHVNPAFVRLLGVFGYGRVFVRAEGTRLTDDQGRTYLDFLAGFGSVNLGHNPPALLERIAALLADPVPNVMHIGPQLAAADLAADLAALAPPLTMALFSCSGGEAVEAALKLARLSTKRAGFVFATGGYHGTNFGGLSVMGVARMRAPFEPLLPSCHEVPFGDLSALRSKLKTRSIAAVLLEPIQGEGGIILPPRGYLAEAKALCEAYGTLLVLDEVQTGMGRTGTLFAYEAEGVIPDALVLGKAFGGSMMPISATLTRRDLFERAFDDMDRFDLHGSTFSGNALACRVARAALSLTLEWDLPRRAKQLGEVLLGRLRAAVRGHPLVKEVRGRGLLVGLELGPTDAGILQRFAPGLTAAFSERVFGQWLAVKLLEKGIIVQPASQKWNVLRFEPPLTVTEEEIDTVVRAVSEVLSQYREMGPVVRDVASRLGAQALSRGAFR